MRIHCSPETGHTKKNIGFKKHPTDDETSTQNLSHFGGQKTAFKEQNYEQSQTKKCSFVQHKGAVLKESTEKKDFRVQEQLIAKTNRNPTTDSTVHKNINAICLKDKNGISKDKCQYIKSENTGRNQIIVITKPNLKTTITKVKDRTVNSNNELRKKLKFSYTGTDKCNDRLQNLSREDKLKSSIENTEHISLKNSNGNNNCTVELQGISEENIDNFKDRRLTSISNFKLTGSKESKKFLAFAKNDICHANDIYHSSSDEMFSSNC